MDAEQRRQERIAGPATSLAEWFDAARAGDVATIRALAQASADFGGENLVTEATEISVFQYFPT